jgi:hypothetical protein
MIISRCCKESVYVVHDYYVCGKCNLACGTLSSLSWMSESYDDTRNDFEIETIFNSA